MDENMDITFDNPLDFTFDDTEIEIITGVVSLKLKGGDYVINGVEIAMDNDLEPFSIYQWKKMEVVSTIPDYTNIQYQYSLNKGVSWNGSWLSASELSRSLPLLALKNDGTDILRLKFNLITTNVAITPLLDNVTLTFAVQPDVSSFEIRTIRMLLQSSGNLEITKVNNERTTSTSNNTIILRRKPVNDIYGIWLTTDNERATDYYTSGSYDRYSGEVITGTVFPSVHQDVYIDYSFDNGLTNFLISESIVTARIIIDRETQRINDFTEDTPFRCQSYLAAWITLLSLQVGNMLQIGFNYRIGDLEVQPKIWGEGQISEVLINQFKEQVYYFLRLMGKDFSVATTDLRASNTYLNINKRIY